MIEKIIDKIHSRWHEINSMAGVGLDPVINKFPKEIWGNVNKNNQAEAIFYFNKQIIDVTAPHVVDYKINPSYYKNSQGKIAQKDTFEYIKKYYPNIVRICDGKFAEVKHTAEEIADEIFGYYDADAVLLNPYVGIDAIKPFTKWKDKLVVLCIKTSNPSANSVQDLKLENGKPLWLHILQTSLSEWNENNNIIPVLSANSPKDLIDIRKEIKQLPVLLSGIGKQGGSLEQSVPPCLDNSGYGIMISASRSILYPIINEGENFVKASEREIVNLKNQINNVKNKTCHF